MRLPLIRCMGGSFLANPLISNEQNTLSRSVSARSMATETELSSSSRASDNSDTYTTSTLPAANADGITTSTSQPLPLPTWKVSPVTATLYDFETMEPLSFLKYHPKQLGLPFRSDILHRAVVHEGDRTRQGTASTKWRGDVHGSGRKVRPQKGSGMARLGDKKSPMLRGGGVAHGPHPRDFSTRLHQKVYDLAWRTALSYRFRRDELIVVRDISLPANATPHCLRNILTTNEWGQKNGRSLLITDTDKERLNSGVEQISEHASVLPQEAVDVKNILGFGRLIVEKKALDHMLEAHSRSLLSKPAAALYE